MIQVEFNKKKENQFYGLRNCLKLLQASTDGSISMYLVDDAWNEVKNSKENRELFYSLLFSIGDITNRQHNIFKGKKKDGGGAANREFFYEIVHWLWKNNKEQFIKFLNAQLFNEYACFDVLLKNRVQTKGNKVLHVFNAFKDKEYRKALLNYVYSVVNGTNPFNKLLIAKFLTIPRTSKRKGHKKMLPETKEVMKEKLSFLTDLSKMMGWEVEYLKGYREWRKQYNGDLESVMFTTGKINEFTKDEFLAWFGKLPAQARFRVKNRILYSEQEKDHPNGGKFTEYKWAKFQPWVKEWETYKEQKQQEQRNLEEKVRQGQASEEDKVKLQKVKKEAKVTVGATNFKEIYDQIGTGQLDKLKVESFMNKVNLPYNSLVIIDSSGSMSGKPFLYAAFIAAVCLCKNPDDDGRNLIGMFDTNSKWYAHIDSQAYAKNSILRTKVAKTKAQPLVDPTKSFLDNYAAIASFLRDKFRGGSTRIDSIAEGLKVACDEAPEILDALRNYPVWTIISDGEFNSMYSPEASMADFFRKCEKYFGFRPYVVLMDICVGWRRPESLKADRFSGIDNMLYIPSNPAMIEMFLTNFKDMETFDVYTPLLSMYRSNRYQLVRENTL